DPFACVIHGGNGLIPSGLNVAGSPDVVVASALVTASRIAPDDGPWHVHVVLFQDGEKLQEFMSVGWMHREIKTLNGLNRDHVPRRRLDASAALASHMLVSLFLVSLPLDRSRLIRTPDRPSVVVRVVSSVTDDGGRKHKCNTRQNVFQHDSKLPELKPSESLIFCEEVKI